MRVVEKTDAREEASEYQSLDELAREGARRMLVGALEAEVSSYLERHADERAADGHAQVVRNGQARPRRVTLGAGTLEIQTPRVNDRRHDARGERQRFTSGILPPYMRRSPKVAEVLPILYLRGLSTGDFRPLARLRTPRSRPPAPCEICRSRLSRRSIFTFPTGRARTLTITRVGAKTTAVETYLIGYKRTIDKNGLTRCTARLQPTGTVTEV